LATSRALGLAYTLGTLLAAASSGWWCCGRFSDPRGYFMGDPFTDGYEHNRLVTR
jgi:hypothetical protein